MIGPYIIKKFKAEILFEAEGYSEKDVKKNILVALKEEVNSGGKHIEAVEMHKDIDDWFEENKYSAILQENFLSCLNDDPDSEHSFKSWATKYYAKTKEL